MRIRFTKFSWIIFNYFIPYQFPTLYSFTVRIATGFFPLTKSNTFCKVTQGIILSISKPVGGPTVATILLLPLILGDNQTAQPVVKKPTAVAIAAGFTGGYQQIKPLSAEFVIVSKKLCEFKFGSYIYKI